MRYSNDRNKMCRELMHAKTVIGNPELTFLNNRLERANSERTNYIGYKNSSKELVREKTKASDLVKMHKATQQARDLEKSVANSEWYEHNKAWKQAYNKDYYQRNKDYWKQRYEQALNKQNSASGMDKVLKDQWNEIRKSGGGNLDWDTRNLEMNNVEFNKNAHESEVNIAKINYERAANEYNNFMKSYGSSPVSSLSSTISNAGKSFLSGAKSAMSSLSSTISSGFSKLKSLFS